MNIAIILPILSLLWAGMRIDNREISLSLIDETYDKVINAKDIYQPTEKAYVIPDNVPRDIELLLIRYSVKYGLPLDVVIRLSEVESNHGAYTKSLIPNFDGSFDIGVLALNSNFHEYFAVRYFEGDPGDFDPNNREHNIQTGLAYLAHLYDLTGDIKLALTAYNCGYNSMKRGDIPLSTQRYVRAVVNGESL